MTDLTEKWKAGELEDGWYYVQYQDNIIDIKFAHHHCWGRCANVDIVTVYFDKNHEVKKVLAPVPSYEELQAIKEENARLKEILKYCVVFMEYAETSHNLPKIIRKAIRKLVTKINEVLK